MASDQVLKNLEKWKVERAMMMGEIYNIIFFTEPGGQQSYHRL